MAPSGPRSFRSTTQAGGLGCGSSLKSALMGQFDPRLASSNGPFRAKIFSIHNPGRRPGLRIIIEIGPEGAVRFAITIVEWPLQGQDLFDPQPRPEAWVADHH